MNLKQTLDAFAASVKQAAAFVDKYANQIPEELQEHMTLTVGSEVQLILSLSYREEEFKSGALAVIGKVFSSRGWTAKPDHSDGTFDWHKEVDGVKILIYAAEKFMREQERPVPSSAFPIMIEDKKEVFVEPIQF